MLPVFAIVKVFEGILETDALVQSSGPDHPPEEAKGGPEKEGRRHSE
jgi:hypothetical protein